IVSPVPQTTRNTIRGIYNDVRGQIVILDTPGMHLSEKKLNLRLRDVVLENLPEAEIVVYTIDATRLPGEEERDLAGIVRNLSVPVIVGITKCDARDARTTKVTAFLADEKLDDLPARELGGLAPDAGATPHGVDELVDAVFDVLPISPPWYPEEFYTDQEPSFRIAEIVREQAIARTRQEVPHALYVEVADLEERSGALWARTFLYVDRISQQGILVGKGGATITAIRREAERMLADIFPNPVRLSLQVKVRPRWRRDDRILKRLIH
ncbi:MAG: GTPase Era, partial [Spirochaetales bacterium]|nr:GTPase Era [Spirochaetales bacterium]